MAAAILRAEGIDGVRIEPVQGILSDHYDPSAKVLRLSPAIFEGRSVAAAGIAAHEVGHALQDARGSLIMRVRQALVPVANIGSMAGPWLVLLGVFMNFSGLAWAGVALFGMAALFFLITLPVELDASKIHEALAFL